MAPDSVLLEDITDKVMEAVALIVGTLGGEVRIPAGSISRAGVDDINQAFRPTNIRARLVWNRTLTGQGGKPITAHDINQASWLVFAREGT